MNKKIKNLVIVGLLVGSITLYADDQYEPNNSMQDAQSIGDGVYHLFGDDEDWFTLDLTPGSLKLVMIPQDSDVDLNMILYNSDGEVVSANFQPHIEEINYNVQFDGRYYIKVFPTTHKTTDYTLEVKSSSDRKFKTALSGFGHIRDVGIALYDIDNDGKKEIFVATSKRLDSSLHEVAPAALIVLEDDGSIKWTKSFPAIDGADPQTGIVYNTTSVSTMPVFANLDDDQEMEMIIGVGGDTYSEAGPDVVGQPGDKGGVYALDNDGKVLWSHYCEDKIGGPTNTGDGRPDGVYGTPKVFDVDGDGKREVIFGCWDQNLWILDAKTGVVKLRQPLLDTIWSSPYIADIDNNGIYEILVNADITENADAKVQTGGIFHVLHSNGAQDQPGFDQPVGDPKYPELKGKYEEQALWSSPIAKDIDHDGWLDIVYGTGNFFHDSRGSYVRVWNYDGSLKYYLATEGRTFATPLVADLDGDGKMEIVENTLAGYTYIWDSDGTLRSVSQVTPYKGSPSDPIFSSPIAIDIDGDGELEIAFVKGAQVILMDAYGNPITDTGSREYIVDEYKGSVAISDIDNNGKLDLISAGASADKSYSYIYDWEVGTPISYGEKRRVGRDQLFGSDYNIRNFVDRFYHTILERSPDAGGLNDWTERLKSGILAGSDVARGFIFSQEFENRNTTDEEYVTILYHAFFNREPDSAGYNGWLERLRNGASRAEVLDGFLYSQEFGNLCRDYNIKPVK